MCICAQKNHQKRPVEGMMRPWKRLWRARITQYSVWCANHLDDVEMRGYSLHLLVPVFAAIQHVWLRGPEVSHVKMMLMCIDDRGRVSYEFSRMPVISSSMATKLQSFSKTWKNNREIHAKASGIQARDFIIAMWCLWYPAGVVNRPWEAQPPGGWDGIHWTASCEDGRKAYMFGTSNLATASAKLDFVTSMVKELQGA